MAFRNFYINTIIRVILLTVVLFLFSLCIVNEYYLRSVYMAALAIGLAAELTFFLTRFIKHIQLFLVNIQQRDFTLHFQEKKSSFQNLYEELNGVISVFKKISSEKEIQHRFLQTLVEHVNVGIISFDDEGKIQLVNNSFLRLLGKMRLASIEDLKLVDREMVGTMHDLCPEETRLVKFHHRNQIQNLALSATEFKLDDKHFKLISVQNITNELNAKELEAWQRLIRVLTHEIMNSVAPIISLSDTLHKLVEKEKPGNSHSAFFETLHGGLEAIKVRSEGLQVFTEAYRQLTRIPMPQFSAVTAEAFFKPIVELLLPELERRRIKLVAEIDSFTFAVDLNLMQQAVINLLWNAVDALGEAQHPVIQISAGHQSDKTRISVMDNGVGMDEATLDKIFIPFFTTKKNGSGIGLALVRQIVQMHKGELRVESSITGGTTFTILL